MDYVHCTHTFEQTLLRLLLYYVSFVYYVNIPCATCRKDIVATCRYV